LEVVVRKFIIILFVLFAIKVNVNSQIIGDSTDIVWQTLMPEGIRDISFSPDSKFILTGHDDYITRIWNVENGSLFAEIPYQEQPVFSHDGKFIASRSNKSIYIWNFPTLDTFKVIPTPCLVYQVSFSNDDKLITSAQQECGLFIWDINTGNLVDTIKTFPFINDPKYGGSPKVNSFCYSPLNNNLIAFSGDWSFVYNLSIDSLISTFNGFAPQYSSNEIYIANYGINGLNLYSSINNVLLKTIAIGKSNYQSTFSPDNKYIVIASESETVAIWDIETGNKKYKYMHWATPHNHVACSNDMKYIVASTVSGRLFLLKAQWNILSIKNSIENPIVIYPNPSSGIVNIKISLPNSDFSNLTISDFNGLSVDKLELGFMKEGSNVIIYDTSTLNNGIYFLQIQSGNLSVTYKLVKE
jgi:WD40 repeat protein